MNFEEFFKRCKEQLEKRGYVFGEDVVEDQAFEDQMSGVYLGLSVYANYQNEIAIQNIKEMERMSQPAPNPNKIILPGMGH